MARKPWSESSFEIPYQSMLADGALSPRSVLLFLVQIALSKYECRE